MPDPHRSDAAHDFETLARRAMARALPTDVRERARGGVAAVSDGAGNVVAHPFGAAHAETPADADTVFRIASMSKSFLAAAVLALRDEGRLDLRAPIRDYLPEARLFWQGEAVDVTCAQLLCNRSGMPEDNAWADRQLDLSRDALQAYAAAGLTLSLPPGSGYQYSNTGMALVGAIVEAVTGQPIEHVVHERFLEPLGLAHTAYTVADLPNDTPVAEGYRTFDGGREFRHEPFLKHGAFGCIGGMLSTVGDIGRWMRFLASAFTAEPEHPHVLRPTTRLEMQSAFTPAQIPAERAEQLESAGYGYGLVVEQDRRFGRILQHAGGLPGWSSHMRWHAASGTGVVVFANSDSFGAGTRATEILRSVLNDTNASSARIDPWPEALDAAKLVDALIRSGGSLARLGEFAAPNLLPDVPAEVRDRQLAELTDRFGDPLEQQEPLERRITSMPNAAELQWGVACAYGDLECSIRLVGLPTPALQSLKIAVAGSTSD
ncbi:MAG TPA: beta-lactamase family protein [Candidatus Agrococcus pullicola]|uniref:Beta-lactamase family protein n=1 Tax=Candidatus Agrococcus pullicola TaxID=2838429 RepID=A0A9D2C9I3_9MICO|nr:beta-lactamase family protein [Candidatus Agrococcus pullicola]